MSTVKTNTLENVAGTASFLVEDLALFSPYAMRNKLINGGMDIWQRGTSFTVTKVGIFTSDRWKVFDTGNSGLMTADKTQSNAYPGFGVLAIRKLSSAVTLRQSIEGGHLQGKTVTISFAIAGSTADGVLDGISFRQRGGTDNAVTNIVIDEPIPTTYTRLSYTTTLLVDSSQIDVTHVDVDINMSGDDVVIAYFAQIQLEEGSMASPFEVRPIGMELSLCQRYYQVIPLNGSGNILADGYYGAGSYLVWRSARPVEMRIVPSSTIALTVLNADGEGIYGESVGIMGVYARVIAAGRAYLTAGSTYIADAEL